jgi:hypothetical protein
MTCKWQLREAGKARSSNGGKRERPVQLKLERAAHESRAAEKYEGVEDHDSLLGCRLGY